MSKVTSLREADQAFSRCIREVEAGEEYVITRKGQPVARLVPLPHKRVLTPEQEAARARALDRMRKGWPIGARSIATNSMRMPGARMSLTAASPRFTLDTNLFVYSVDTAAGSRHQLALQIVHKAPEVDCWVSLQSLSEFYAVVTRKGMMPAADAAAQVADWLSVFRSIAVSATSIRAAFADAVAGHASYCDALLVATAAEAGCRLILTEDFADGTTLGGVTIHNPFARAGRAGARPARPMIRAGRRGFQAPNGCVAIQCRAISMRRANHTRSCPAA